MRYNGFWILAALSVILFLSPQVFAIPVDLSAFDLRDDDDIFYFGPNNSSAIIYEDIFLNAPSDPSTGLGPVTLLDHNLPIPSDALSLTFDYELTVAPGNEDYLDFYFDGLSSPSDWFGGHNNSSAADLIFAGTITKDLTGYAGRILPIAFVLYYGWDDGLIYDSAGTSTFVGNEYDSILTITNVEINPVPEPATLLLFSSGIIAMIGFKKRRISGVRQ